MRRRKSFLIRAGLLLTVCLAASSFAAPIADLEVVTLTLFGPQSVTPGETIDGRLLLMVRNMTSEPVGSFSIALYLSTDPVITVSDQLLVAGREVLTEFPAYGTDAWPGFDGLAIPGGWPTGPAYLGVIIDEFGVVTEMDEANNVAAIPIDVTAGPATVRQVPGVYSTITAAIAAAAPGDTIDIGPGEYNEALVVDKDLVFRGAGWDQTILKTDAAPVAIMVVANADLIIENLQFWSWFGDFFVGKAIHADNSSLFVRNCKLVEINQFFIEVYTGALGVDNIEMTRSIGVADIGVRVFNAAFSFRNSYGGPRLDHVFDVREISAGLVENNTIDGSTVYWAQGVRLMNDAVAVIRDNVMVGQHTPETQRTHQPGGVAMHDECYADIHDNDIRGFVYGLYFGNNADAKVYDNVLEEAAWLGVRCNHEYPSYDGSVPDLGGGQYNSPGHNIIRNNEEYNVQNNSAETVFARWNDWGVTTWPLIDNTLYDDDEDVLLGPVEFIPANIFVYLGDWVEINLAPDFTIVFEQVYGEGFASLTVGTEGPPPPPDLPVVPATAPRYYDVSTDAAYLGDVEIRLTYDESELTGSEANVAPFHYEGDTWVNTTTGHDPGSDQVFGVVTSLSPFIVVELPTCCVGRVGDANGSGDDEPTIGDLSVMIDALFIGGDWGVIPCLAEADVNQSGGTNPETGDITIGDVSYLIDYLFITGSGIGLPDCF